MSDITPLAREVAGWVGEILKKEIDPSRLDALLVDDYGADSMDMVDIVEAMERKYGFVVPDDQLLKFKTLEDVVSRIQAEAA